MKRYSKPALRRWLLPASPEIPVSRAGKAFFGPDNAPINPIQPHSSSPLLPRNECESLARLLLYPQNAVLSP